MTKSKISVSNYKGLYFRTLGRAADSNGKVSPKKFLLGRDPDAAVYANGRLEKLWGRVVDRHQRLVSTGATAIEKKDGSVLEVLWLKTDLNRITGRGGDRPAVLTDEPVWTEEAMRIAEAVRNGQEELIVEAGPELEPPFDFLLRVTTLARDYGEIITFAPSNEAAFQASREFVKASAVQEMKSAARLAEMAGTDIENVSGQTLYQVLDAFAVYAKDRNKKEHGKKEAERANSLKQSHVDVSLSRFGMTSLQKIAAFWSSRPLTKKGRTPLAIDSVKNILKTARRFIDWLHASDLFNWSMPAQAEKALRVRVDRLLTEDEIADLGDGVPVWTAEELKLLYYWATDRDRLFILLGLNCGFLQSDICALRVKQMEDGKIRRLRGKSRVAAVWPLWPTTIKAIKWYRSVMSGVATEYQDHVFVSDRGALLDRQGIANAWNHLLRRVAKRHPSFKRLPFKFLRKTSGNMVRSVSDGEVMKVFLAHGKPVSGDPLSEMYSNKPFDKVAVALEKVGLLMAPVFDAAPDAFTQGTARRTAKAIHQTRKVG